MGDTIAGIRKVTMATTERDVLESKVLPELQAIASSMGVQGYLRLRKADLIGAIIAKAQGVEFTPSSTPTRSRRAGSTTAVAEPAIAAAPPTPPVDAAPEPQPAATAPQASSTAPAAPVAPAPAANGSAPAEAAAPAPAVDAPAREAGSDEGEKPEPRSTIDVDLAEIVEPTSSRRTRRRRRRGGRGDEDGDGVEQLPGLGETQAGGQAGDKAGDKAGGQSEGGEQPAQSGGDGAAPSANGQAPSADAQAQGGGQQQADNRNSGSNTNTEIDRGPRRNERDWNSRWDSGPQQGGGRRSRNRNRNRNNRGGGGGGGGNRFDGNIAVADRPDYRNAVNDDRPEVARTGILDIRSQDGYGFIRVNGYLPGPEDAYVPLSMIRRMGLRRGDQVDAQVKLPRDSEKYAACTRIDRVNGMDPDEARQRSDFKDMTPLYPQERLRLEHNPTEISTRVMDLMCPIGKGQRGLIVSPPKAGKTTIMKQIANAVSENNPEVHLIILLTDERPEEVTDMQRSTKAEVVYSTFDRPSEDHCQVSELTIERAKRLVEYGKDVMILLDGITRLSRAYNLATPASGKILSGGVDSSALYPPKRFFGAARNLEDGGSLTILATALVDTGSRMDEVIFEEFKGTGNMEVRLDRKLSERRIFPALDIDASSTRKEELLLAPEELVVAWKLRRVLGALDPAQALELVVDKMRASKTNEQFLRDIQRANIG
jgi:transcription termination factor Rho